MVSELSIREIKSPSRYPARSAAFAAKIRCTILILTLPLVWVVAGADVKKGEFGAAGPGNRESPKKKPPEKTARSYPFHGVLGAATESSITLQGKTKSRVIKVTSKTYITRDGKPARIEEAVTGEKVSGSVSKNEDGMEEALTLRLKGK